jgi:hypothetical protein
MYSVCTGLYVCVCVCVCVCSYVSSLLTPTPPGQALSCGIVSCKDPLEFLPHDETGKALQAALRAQQRPPLSSTFPVPIALP